MTDEARQRIELHLKTGKYPHRQSLARDLNISDIQAQELIDEGLGEDDAVEIAELL